MRAWAKRILRWTFGPVVAHRWLFGAALLAALWYGMLSLHAGHIARLNAHGWPRQYVSRFSNDLPIASRLQPWQNVVEFSATGLATDGLFAIGLALLVVHLWSLHCRLNSKPWQFRIAELLAVAVVIGALLGGAVHFDRAHKAELAYAQSLFRRSPSPLQSYFVAAQVCPPWQLQPFADLGLVGDDWTQHHILVLDGRPDVDQFLTDEVAKGRQLRELQNLVVVNSALSDDGINALCTWAPNCNSLCISNCPLVSKRGVDTIVARLPTLTMLSVSAASLSVSSLRSLSTLPLLNQLYIVDADNAHLSWEKHCIGRGAATDGFLIPTKWQFEVADVERLRQRGVAVMLAPPMWSP